MLSIAVPLAKSITASVTGIGFPLGSVVVPVFVSTSSVTGVGVFLPSFVG